MHRLPSGACPPDRFLCLHKDLTCLVCSRSRSRSPSPSFHQWELGTSSGLCLCQFRVGSKNWFAFPWAREPPVSRVMTSQYTSQPCGQFLYLLASLPWLAISCEALYRQSCGFPNHVQLTEFLTSEAETVRSVEIQRLIHSRLNYFLALLRFIYLFTFHTAFLFGKK